MNGISFDMDLHRNAFAEMEYPVWMGGFRDQKSGSNLLWAVPFCGSYALGWDFKNKYYGLELSGYVTSMGNAVSCDNFMSASILTVIFDATAGQGVVMLAVFAYLKEWELHPYDGEVRWYPEREVELLLKGK